MWRCKAALLINGWSNNYKQTFAIHWNMQWYCFPHVHGQIEGKADQLRQPIGRRSETWQCGARTTTFASTWVRQRSWSWTTWTTHPHSHRRDCLSSLVSTSPTNHHGPNTPRQLWRGHNNTLPRFGMGPQILKKFYSCSIESFLTGCITAWYGKCKAQQRVVLTAQYITGDKLPAI